MLLRTLYVRIRDAPIIGRFADNWYRPTVIYTTCKYKFLLLFPKVKKNMTVASVSSKSGFVL